MSKKIYLQAYKFGALNVQNESDKVKAKRHLELLLELCAEVEYKNHHQV